MNTCSLPNRPFKLATGWPMNEADTCRKLVRPKLEAAGWDGEKHFYSEQTSFTDGRIIAPAGKPRRLKKKFSDFLLRYTRDITLAVVEAKSDRRPPDRIQTDHRTGNSGPGRQGKVVFQH